MDSYCVRTPNWENCSQFSKHLTTPPLPDMVMQRTKTATNRSRHSLVIRYFNRQHGQTDIFSEEKVLGHPDVIDMAVRQERNRILLVDLFHTCWEEA